MTKTRNLSDLLDSNGDVKSTALDNVPASNDASALTTGTLPNDRLSAVPNSALANSSITINGTATALGGSISVATTDASSLTTGTLDSARLGTITNFTSTGIDDNATSTAVTIDSSNRLLVGTTNITPASSNVNGFVISNSQIGASRDGTVAEINRISTDGTLVNFRKDGTTVGNIGSFSSLPYFAGSSYGILIGSGNVVPSTNTGAISNNSMDLGASNRKFKDGYFGGYVYSDNTANAWVHFNGTGTVAIKDDFNVSSITDSGTGNYFINYSSNLANTTYSFAMSSARNSATQYCVTTLEDIQVSGFRVHNANFGSALVDNAYISLMVIGG